MSIIEVLSKLSRSYSRIIVVLALITVLTMGMTIQLQPQQSIALGIDDLSNFKGLSGIGLSNNCVAFECNNQQAVDNSKTITGNTNSNIVSESDNTNMGNSNSNSSQPNPPIQSPCIQCFVNANLSTTDQQLLFEAFGVTSFEELCNVLAGGDVATVSEELSNIISLEQSEPIVDCLISAGVLVFSG